MLSELMTARSKFLFGQSHRLALMIAIAKSKTGRVNPTDLADELGLAQSAFQAPLRDLLNARLLLREEGQRRKIYVRQRSKAWEWVLELDAQLRKEDAERVPTLLSSS